MQSAGLPNEMTTSLPRQARVLAIGVDAAEPELLERWMAEGSLPTICQVVQEGAYTRLESVADAFSDAVWPSFYTGTGPATHGYYYFRQVKPGTVQMLPTMNRSHRRPFWWLLRDLGKSVVIFDVPKAPIQEASPGLRPGEGATLQVVGWGERYPFVRASRPRELYREIQRRFGRHPHTQGVFRPRSVKQQQKLLRDLLAGVERRAEAIRYLMSQAPWDLFITAFSESHSAGHQYYHLDPTSPNYDPQRAQVVERALLDVYARIDAAIAHVLETVPPDTNILLFSVHGMGSKYTTRAFLQPVLERLGYQVPNSGTPDPLRALRDRLPRWLRDQINGALPLSTQSTLISRYFENGSDWRQTWAVAEDWGEGPPWIRVNLRGREPWGTVEPGEDYDDLCAEITSDLMKLRIYPGGQPAVRAVHRTDQLFRGPHVRELPDMVVHWERGTAISVLEHPAVGLITSDLPSIQESEHTPRGFLAAAGPHFSPGAKLSHAHIMDLAPTLLHLMGSPIPSDMEGRVLTELTEGDSLVGPAIKVDDASWHVPAWPE